MKSRFAAALFLGGLATLLSDVFVYNHFGSHLNEIAGFTEDGQVLNFPTGEAGLLEAIPVRLCALALCLIAIAVFVLKTRVSTVYRAHIIRGTE